MLRAAIVIAVILAGIAAWVVAGGYVPTFADLAATKSAGPAANQKGSAAAGPDAKIAVEAETAESTTTTTDIRAIGSLQSDESVQIASEIAGRITEIPFGEGTSVAAGDVLVKLDDALAVAEVADMEARFDLATGNLSRANTLARSGNVTERAHDEATANAQSAGAALELAKVRLDKHTIRAPFPGVVGIRKVSPGAYVAVGEPLVNIEKIDKLKVDFKVPELFLEQVRVGQTVEVSVDALPGRTFTATIYAIDPHIDVNGRALSIRATLPNPNQELRPGLFVRILVKGATKQNVLVIPESAVVPRGQDKIVFAIENGQAVETKVKLGARAEGRVEILDGLKPHAVVVTAGQQKLRNGSNVEVVAGANEPAATGEKAPGSGS